MTSPDQNAAPSSAAQEAGRVSLPVHLLAGALATLGTLGMLGALPLPAPVVTGVGALLIAASALVIAWANRRHGRARRSALSFNLTSVMGVVLAIALGLTVVFFPQDSPLVLRVLIALIVGLVFLTLVRWEDSVLTRRIARERSPLAPAHR